MKNPSEPSEVTCVGSSRFFPAWVICTASGNGRNSSLIGGGGERSKGGRVYVKLVAGNFHGDGDAGARGEVIHDLAPVSNTDGHTLQMGSTTDRS